MQRKNNIYALHTFSKFKLFTNNDYNLKFSCNTFDNYSLRKTNYKI